MATFVLVPGFWLGAWERDTVAEQLRAAGHTVHPLTRLGVAERRRGRPEAQEAQRRLVAEQGEGRLLPPPPFDPAAGPVNLAGISE